MNERDSTPATATEPTPKNQEHPLKNRDIYIDDFKKRSHHVLNIEGVEVYFPFEPYSVQQDYMRSVIRSLNTSSNALLQSPTGTGKTLALLCSALGWLRARRQSPDSKSFNRILFCSRTHSQLKQIVKELKRTAYKAKVCILASRDQYCLKKEFANLKDLELNGACKKSVLDKSCQFYNHTGSDKRQVRRIFDEVLDIEDLQAKASITSSASCGKFCPYYYSREIKDEADIVILPYSFLLQQNRFIDFQVVIKDSIIIFDEAHNVPASAEEGTSYKVDQSLISESRKELEYLQSHLTPAMRTKPKDIEDVLQLVLAFGNLLQHFEKSQSLEKQRDGSIGKLSKMAYFFDMIEQISGQLLRAKKQHGDKQYSSMLKGLKNSKDKKSKQAALQGQTTLFNFSFKKTVTPTTVSTEKMDFQFVENVKKEFAEDHLNDIQYNEFEEDLNEGSSSSGSLSKIIQINRKMSNIIADMQTMKCQNIDFFAGFISGLCNMHSQDVQFQKGVAANRISDYYRFYFHKGTKLNDKSSINLWCLDPSLAFANIVKQQPHSIILTSGTLDPMNSWDSELKIPFQVKLGTTHVIDSKQSVLAAVVKQGKTGTQLNFSYNNRQQNSSQTFEELGEFIVDLSTKVPNGILVVFSSGSVMRIAQDTWNQSANRIVSRINQFKEMYFEPQNNLELSSIMKHYCINACNDSKGAILFCVCRGKISEGIDFTDKLARAVVIVGVPFPPSMDTWVCTKMEYLEANQKEQVQPNNSISGREWYFLSTVRAINQAIGRVIRHKDDYGAVFLCDSRFGQTQFSEHISNWVKDSLSTYETYPLLTQALDNFFNGKKSNITSLDKLLDLGGKIPSIDQPIFDKSFKTETTTSSTPVVITSSKRLSGLSYSTKYQSQKSSLHQFTAIFAENSKKKFELNNQITQFDPVNYKQDEFTPHDFNWNGLNRNSPQSQNINASTEKIQIHNYANQLRTGFTFDVADSSCLLGSEMNPGSLNNLMINNSKQGTSSIQLNDLFREYEYEQHISGEICKQNRPKPLRVLNGQNGSAFSSFKDQFKLNLSVAQQQPKTFDKAMLCNTAKGLGSFKAGDIVSIKSNMETVDQDENQKKSSGMSSESSVNLIQQEQIDDAVMCPICYETPKNNHVNTNCSHKACYECWKKWLSQQLTCPMCRTRCRMVYLEPCE